MHDDLKELRKLPPEIHNKTLYELCATDIKLITSINLSDYVIKKIYDKFRVNMDDMRLNIINKYCK